MTKSPNIRHLSFLSLLLLLLLLHLPKARSEPNATYPVYYRNITFHSFTEDNKSNLILTSVDSSISQGALQITPDSINDPNSYLKNKSGRVFFKDPFKLWEDRDHPLLRYVASFNITFSINIYRPNNTTPGEGLAFVIATDAASPPPGSYGGYLGLTNATTDGNPSNGFVAVELDTVKEDYDPDDNHVGLNLNSVHSNITNPLKQPFNITIATPGNGTNYTVWIDYNGVARHISVYMAVRGQSKPNFTVLNTSLDISNYVQQWSYFGFSASTSNMYELNCVLDWNITVENLGDDRNPGTWKWYLLGGLVLGALVVAMLLLVLCSKRRKREGLVDRRVLSDKLKSLPGMPREFKFETLKKATNKFDKKMKLGEGGFGEVYKGLLPAENVTVAVKKFSRGSSKGQDDFLAELTIINCLRHKHLVPLLGEFFLLLFFS